MYIISKVFVCPLSDVGDRLNLQIRVFVVLVSREQGSASGDIGGRYGAVVGYYSRSTTVCHSKRGWEIVGVERQEMQNARRRAKMAFCFVLFTRTVTREFAFKLLSEDAATSGGNTFFFFSPAHFREDVVDTVYGRRETFERNDLFRKKDAPSSIRGCSIPFRVS